MVTLPFFLAEMTFAWGDFLGEEGFENGGMGNCFGGDETRWIEQFQAVHCCDVCARRFPWGFTF